MSSVDDDATFMSAGHQTDDATSSSSATSKVDASRALTKELAQYRRLLYNLLRMAPLTGGEGKEKYSQSLPRLQGLFLLFLLRERVFSKLGRVCAKERAHINLIMADVLTFLASNRA